MKVSAGIPRLAGRRRILPATGFRVLKKLRKRMRGRAGRGRGCSSRSMRVGARRVCGRFFVRLPAGQSLVTAPGCFCICPACFGARVEMEVEVCGPLYCDGDSSS